ncbi:MAG: hypothetical protein HGA85_03540, partial [Nanoarchaeota archaeon]|nr:hypothetical protein [Nanoarchaeota archaeon]
SLAELKRLHDTIIQAAERSPWLYPVREADTVVIEDKPGLQKLVKMTKEDRDYEFSTWLREHQYGNTVKVHEILSPNLLLQKGFSNWNKRSMELYTQSRDGRDVAQEFSCWNEGDTGGQFHFHPTKGTAMFRTSYGDVEHAFNFRNIHFISFLPNTKTNPAMLGYSAFDIYIPQDRDFKVFKRAGKLSLANYILSF